MNELVEVNEWTNDWVNGWMNEWIRSCTLVLTVRIATCCYRPGLMPNWRRPSCWSWPWSKSIASEETPPPKCRSAFWRACARSSSSSKTKPEATRTCTRSSSAVCTGASLNSIKVTTLMVKVTVSNAAIKVAIKVTVSKVTYPIGRRSLRLKVLNNIKDTLMCLVSWKKSITVFKGAIQLACRQEMARWLLVSLSIT